MCHNIHRIVLKNVNTGDKTPTALILIHGYVESPCATSLLTISTNHSVTHHELHSGPEFKCLLALSAGENQFSLFYCNTTIPLVIHHVPSTLPFDVVPLYIICKGHDGHFQSPSPHTHSTAQVACQRIDLMIQLVQLIYAEKFHEAQLGRKSFRIGKSCGEYFSNLLLENALEMSEQELWDYLADEVIRREGAEVVSNRKYVAILGCTQFQGCPDEDHSYETIKRRTKARAAIGGGGLVVFNTGCLYTWPDTLADVERAFRNNQPIDLTSFADDSNYRRTLGGCFATNLGSLCHELGHAFDLGHTEEGIMGRSFDSTEQLFLPWDSVQRKVLPKRSSPGRQTAAADVPVARLTRVRTNGAVLRDYRKARECNGIYFTRNCLAILANHKWFQDERSGRKTECQKKIKEEEEKGQPHLLWFSAIKRMVKAVYPLRLVELREEGSEMVKHFWEFSPAQEGEEKTEFGLPPLTEQGRPWILFVIDCQGNTLKCRI